MRLKNDEYELLKRIRWELISGNKSELAAQLQALLTRFEIAREKRREHNRVNASAKCEAIEHKWEAGQLSKTGE